MRHPSEFDAFEQSLQDKIKEFGEMPSEQVWEGLEKQWAEQDAGFLRGNLFWLWVGLISLSGTALWGWHALEGMEQQGSPMLRLTEIQPTEPICVDELVSQDEQLSMTYMSYDSIASNKTNSVSLSPIPSQAISLLASSQKNRMPLSPPFQEIGQAIFVEKPLEATNGMLTEEEEKSEKRTIQKRKRKRFKKPSLRNWWSSPRNWSGGESWDYQIGVYAGAENYSTQGRIVLGALNSVSSQTHAGLNLEFVPNHRLRFNVGGEWNRSSLDYGERNLSQTRLELFPLIITQNLPIDTSQVISYKLHSQTHIFTIPIGILLFLSPPEKETQFWTGLQIRQNVWQNYSQQYIVGLRRSNDPINGIWYEESNSSFVRSYRLMLGLEQRLSKSLRLRAHGHYTIDESLLFHRYGASLSLYWASPRGPLRWRDMRRKRILH